MCKMYLNRVVLLFAVSLLVVVMSQMASAFPSRGGGCIDCHDNPAGAMNITPNPIDLAPGSNGVVMFNITSLPGVNNAIALEGLEDASLDATIGSIDNWTFETGINGQSYISDIITTTGSYLLNLEIGASAVESIYDITAYLVGKGQAGASYNFSVNVVPDYSADFDSDGDVDGADFLLWQAGFGMIGGATKGQGDANRDGNVFTDDLAIWQTQYDNPPPLLSLNAVPEPKTLVLVTFCMAIACCWRHSC